MSDVLILIPAAGASSRMRGADKLMEGVDGEPLLRRQVLRALDSGAAVLVTLSSDHPARREVLQNIDHKQFFAQDIDGREGMAVSLRTGAALALRRDAEGMMVLPADMPDLDAADLRSVLDAFARIPDTIHRAASKDGQPGHPVVFPRRLFPALRTVSGDQGGRSLLQGEDIRLLRLPGDHALIDLDTPEDWAAWRAQRGQPASS